MPTTKTLIEYDYGTVINVKENDTLIPYILISKDPYSCELLRQDCVVAKRMNNTNTTDYTDCEMDQYLSSDSTGGFLERFDSNTKAALVMRSISTFSYGDTDCHYISRKCYLPSYGQVFTNGQTALYPEKTIIPALFLWKGTIEGNSARIAKDNLAASAVYWWLRSPISAVAYRSVHYDGSAYFNGATNTGVWCRPVLSVASATLVGDDGAGTLLLAPVDTHREVEFEGLVGTSSIRPRKAYVQYTAHGLTNLSVQVCNNYGDDNPVWVDATAGTEITFLNETKQTPQWQVGIKCYGDTDSWSSGYFKEPTVLVEV
jgi:hypothetical protein